LVFNEKNAWAYRKWPSCNETPKGLLALKKWALGARRSSGAVCFGRTGKVVYSGRTALGKAVCFGWFALAPCRLECFSYRFIVSFNCQLFVTNPKTFTAFVYFIFPLSNSKRLPTSAKFFSLWGNLCQINTHRL